jgi:hypothetical protein
MGELHIDIDPKSPQGQWARSTAQILIAARMGGKETYLAEFRKLFGGKRTFNEESLVTLLHLADALVLVGDVLAVAATHPDEDLQAELKEMRDDPQAILAFVDRLIDKQLADESGPER